MPVLQEVILPALSDEIVEIVLAQADGCEDILPAAFKGLVLHFNHGVSVVADIVKGGEELEKVLFEKYGRSVGFGVGVHCGPAVVGNVGCDVRMDYTAIGDTVNTSARLEANAKKGQVLISDVLYERLKGRIRVNEIGVIPLKGKSNGVNVFEVLGVDGEE